MNFLLGAHSARPQGRIRYSMSIYANKHMSWLGVAYLTERLHKGRTRMEPLWNQSWQTWRKTNQHYKSSPELILAQHTLLLSHPLLTDLATTVLPANYTCSTFPTSETNHGSCVRFHH
eukprot:5393707-Prymnesium_polylepis.1